MMLKVVAHLAPGSLIMGRGSAAKPAVIMQTHESCKILISRTTCPQTFVFYPDLDGVLWEYRDG